MTVNTMELLETKPINDLTEEVIIKVCYVSDQPNRNNTIINREVGKNIAATLPGAPIVGFYDKEKGDFVEHSRKIEIKDGQVYVNEITQAYGFVSPFDQPWYQDFEEDGTTRTYLMCKGYLWTHQYEEAGKAIGKGQSMEIADKGMDGYYTNSDVFIFTNATLDKLCILGNDYEPCFEGASIIKSYVTQYKTAAEQLEEVMGKRFFIKNDKLCLKENVSLDYAIELGWNLNSAVEGQLMARGMTNHFIVGIFSENGKAFCIVQNAITLEYDRINLIIHSDETIELDSDVVAVTMAWIPKGPPAVEPTASPTGTEIQPAPPPAPAYEVTQERQVPLLSSKESIKSGGENAMSDQEKVITEPIAEFTETEKVEEKIPDEPIAEFTETEKVEEKIPDEPVAEFTEQAPDSIGAFELQLQAQAEKIAQLEAIVEEYTSAKKDQVIDSYSTLLTSEEMEEVTSKKAEYSLDELDAKLALLFAKKAKETSNFPISQNFQVNVETIAPQEPELPSFIRQAKEYDEAHTINLRLI